MLSADPNPKLHQVTVPVADIRDEPGGARLRQLVYGETVEQIGDREGWIAVRAVRDGYRGVMKPTDLAPAQEATHRVIALGTHLYAAPDIKARDTEGLSFGSRLTLDGDSDGFLRTHDGRYVPKVHVTRVGRHFRDPAGVAELFLGTPYLWGGNSRLGLDCSGLVQIACHACGIPCPGDSGDQAREAGTPVGIEVPLARGDLLFWDGHVAMAVAPDRLIHANAHHMAVVFELAEEAVRRIAKQGGGRLIARRRLLVD
ncbi:MAG: C40 family peptidase [Rhodobacteraceae bacterium]|nr:C40 family peptidase [Paracoccaceae bacterium]